MILKNQDSRWVNASEKLQKKPRKWVKGYFYDTKSADAVNTKYELIQDIAYDVIMNAGVKGF